MSQNEVKILLEELYSKTANDNIYDINKLYGMIEKLIIVLKNKRIINKNEAQDILIVSRDIIESDDNNE